MRYAGIYNQCRMLQADKPYLAISDYVIWGTDTPDICYTEHRTERAAIREAKRRKGIAVRWNPFHVNGRIWEPIHA